MARKSRLYRLYDKGEYIGTYSCKEIADITGCPTQRVCVEARQMSFYKKRWQFVAFTSDNKIEGFAYDFEKEWNEARINAYKKLGKSIYICDYCSRIIDEKHIKVQEKHMHYECFKKKCEGE